MAINNKRRYFFIGCFITTLFAVAIASAFRGSSSTSEEHHSYENKNRSHSGNPNSSKSSFTNKQPRASQENYELNHLYDKPNNGIKIYSANTQSNARNLLKYLPNYNPDKITVSYQIQNFCNSRWDSPGTTEVATLRRLAKKKGKQLSSDEVRSAEYLDAFRDTFCDEQLDEVEPPYAGEYWEELGQAASASDDETFRALAGISHLDKSEAATELERILLKTQSPYVFLKAGQALASGTYGSWELGEEMLPVSMAHALPDTVQSIAVMLAYCDIFGGCGSGTLWSVRACRPTQCEPGMSVQSYFAKTNSPDVMRMAYQLARRIEQLRMR